MSELQLQKDELKKRYDEFKARGLALDMTRGKPAPEQLDLARGLLDLPGADDFKSAAGVDTRNYGGLEGLPEMRAIFGGMLGVSAEQVIIGGNASLTLMHDVVLRALLHGVPGGKGPWRTGSEWPVKFLCPVPGYDRHFSICSHHGIEMVNVELKSDGPDMDHVESLLKSDASIKGIWCVPKYGNPTGGTYSDTVVTRLAQMKTAAPDFRIMWDNAYAEHHINYPGDNLANIYEACAAAGNVDRVLIFGSTSKISFAGAGVAAMAASPANVADQLRHLVMQTIGPDKVNQLRHVRFFKDLSGLRAHMKKHAEILKPKFDAVDRVLTEELGGKGVAEWTKPNGGYFVSLNMGDGLAARVVTLAAEAGVKLTNAGATFPLGKDPRDRNIRIAPSLPSLEEIEAAMRGLAICVLLATAEKG